MHHRQGRRGGQNSRPAPNPDGPRKQPHSPSIHCNFDRAGAHTCKQQTGRPGVIPLVARSQSRNCLGTGIFRARSRSAEHQPASSTDPGTRLATTPDPVRPSRLQRGSRRCSSPTWTDGRVRQPAVWATVPMPKTWSRDSFVRAWLGFSDLRERGTGAVLAVPHRAVGAERLPDSAGGARETLRQCCTSKPASKSGVSDEPGPFERFDRIDLVRPGARDCST
jgi:hypothetical protein